MKYEDSYLEDDHIITSAPKKGGVVSRGFEIELSDLGNATSEYLDDLEDAFRVVMKQTNFNTGIQFQWSVDTDYEKELAHYKSNTEALEKKEGVSQMELHVRNRTYDRFHEKMERKELRKEKLQVYFSIEIQGLGKSAKDYQRNINDAKKEIENCEAILTQNVKGMYGQCFPMDDLAHLHAFYRYYNPDSYETNKDSLDQYLDSLDILTVGKICFLNEGSAKGLRKPEYITDNKHCCILPLSTVPTSTKIGEIAKLIQLEIRDYRIICNLRKQDETKEVKNLEADIAKINTTITEARSKGKVLRKEARLLGTKKGKEIRIERLQSNEVNPFQFQWAVQIYADTEEELRSKCASIKTEVSKMASGDLYNPNLGTTIFELWSNFMPSASINKGDFWHYIEDPNLVSMLPLSSTATGDIEYGEAFFDGANNNIIGLTTFVGKKGSMRPEHGVLIGGSGSGKSVLTIDLALQISGFSDFIAIVEDGESWINFTRLLGSEPVYITPTGDLTFNYLDPKGLPYSPNHVGEAVATLMAMVGLTNDIDKNKNRSAMLSLKVKELLKEKFIEWLNENPAERKKETATWYLGVHKSFLDNQITGEFVYEHLIECWRMKKDGGAEFDSWKEKYLDTVTQLEVDEFSSGSINAEKMMEVGYLIMKADDMPTHSDLVNLLQMNASKDEEFKILATRLATWKHDGIHGKILDGANNVDLSKMRVAHFELSKIPQASEELRAIASFLIVTTIKSFCMGMKRNVRKLVLLEELSAFLDIPGGSKIVKDMYERFRKYNAVTFSIIQQYERIKNDPEARASILGNSRQAILLKNNNRSELVDFSEFFPLSDAVIDNIKNFPDPSEMKRNPHGSLAVSHGRKFFTGKHFASASILKIASTSGEAFEETKNELAQKDEETTLFEIFNQD